MRVTFVGYKCENFTLSVGNIDFRQDNIGERQNLSGMGSIHI